MDLFSVTTGSAGLVSLGITICDGLLTYCHTYQSRENELNVLDDHTKRLKVFLQEIEKRLQTSPVADVSFHSTVMECLSACECCVQDVQALNSKYSPLRGTPNSSMKDRGKSALRKFQFPFEADRFEVLKKQLNDFRSALSGFLLVMNYDLTKELRDNIESRSTALASTISSQGRGLSLQLALMEPSITYALDKGLTKLENSIKEQFASFGKQWENSSQKSNTRQSALNANMTRVTATHPHRESVVQFDSLCSCSVNRPQQHEKSCFRSFQVKKVHIIAGKLRVFSYLLHLRLEIQRAPHAFARDLKVYPNFSMRSTVPCDSKAFRLVWKAYAGMYSLVAPELEKAFRGCLVGLRKLFDEGKAWPTDVATDGRSLLHIACHSSSGNLDDDTAVIYLQFLKELIHLGVPLNEMEHAWNDTPLSFMIHQSNFWSMSRFRRSSLPSSVDSLRSDCLYDRIAIQLMESGAELPETKETRLFGSQGPYLLPMLHRGSTGLEDDIGYGVLSCALIQQSESDVRRLLSRSQSYISEKSRRSESPLHVATPWPRGVELLLRLGGEAIEGILNETNAFNESPLDYALQLGQLSSIQLMVHANAEIDLEATCNIETTAPKHVNSPQLDDIINFLCEALADRRKRMLCLALEWLPEHEISRLRLKDEEMLQDTAFEVGELFRHHVHHLSSWFRNVQPGCIYHSACLSINLARALLKVGFQGPNRAFHGFTPLMTVDTWFLDRRRHLKGTVDLVTWFLDQGASLHSSIPVSGLRGLPTRPITPNACFKAVHRIADAYGKGLYWSHITAEDHLQIGQMHGILSDSSADPCICYCSLKGCTAATLCIRGHFNKHGWYNPKSPKPMHDAIELMSILLSKGLDLDIATDIIRVSTFHRLGMKHTCCKYIGQDFEAVRAGVTHAILAGQYKIVDLMDPEEVAEIQEEDQYLALRLEALVAEFRAKYDEQKVSFHDFFWGYWWQRMDEVEAERDEVCADDLGSIQEIGVILDGEQ